MSWYKKYKISEKETLDFLSGIKELGPQDYSKENQNLYGDYQRRRNFIHEYGWSVPNEEAINSIKDFVENDSILEIGSGLGTWAKLLQSEGISVTPTDLSLDPKENPYIIEKKPYTNVDQINADKAIKKYGNHKVLMMVWPPYDSPMAYNALKLFAGDKLIFVGEGHGGCTADGNFFNLLESDWNHVENVFIPRWSGIHDSLSLYKRKMNLLEV